MKTSKAMAMVAVAVILTVILGGADSQLLPKQLGNLNLEDQLASIFHKVANAQNAREPTTTTTKRPTTPVRPWIFPSLRPSHDGSDIYRNNAGPPVTRRPEILFTFPSSDQFTSPSTTTSTSTTTTTTATTTTTTPKPTTTTTTPRTTTTARPSRFDDEAFKNILDSVPSQPAPSSSPRRPESDEEDPELAPDFADSYPSYHDANVGANIGGVQDFGDGEELALPESSPQPDIKVVPQLENANASDDTPDPKIISVQLGNMWTAYVYISGTVFGLLAVVSFGGLVYRWANRSWLLPKGCSLPALVLLLILNVSRSFSLFYDANNVGKFLPPILGHFVFDVAFPSMMSAFAFVLLGSLRAGKVKVLSPCLYNPATVAGFAVISFLFTGLCDVTMGSDVVETATVQLVKRIVFVIWSLVTLAWFFCAWRHLNATADSSCHQEYESEVFTLRSTMGKELTDSTRSRLRRVVHALIFVGFFLFVLAIVKTIGIACVYAKVAEDGRPLYAMVRPWFVYNVGVRILEILVCATLLYAVLQPVRKAQHLHHNQQASLDGNQSTKPINACDVFCMSPCGGAGGANTTGSSRHSCANDTKSSCVGTPLRHGSLANYHPDHLYEHVNHRPGPHQPPMYSQTCYFANYNANYPRKPGPVSSTASASTEKPPRSAGYCTVIDATLPTTRVCKMPIYEIPYQCCGDAVVMPHPTHCPCRDLQLSHARHVRGTSSASTNAGIQTTSRNEIRRSKQRRKQQQQGQRNHNTADRDFCYRSGVCSSTGALDTTGGAAVPQNYEPSEHLYNVEVDADSSRGTWNPEEDAEPRIAPKNLEHAAYAALVDYNYTKDQFSSFPAYNRQYDEQSQQKKLTRLLAMANDSDSDLYGSNELEEGNVDEADDYYYRHNNRPSELKGLSTLANGSYDVTPDSAVVADVNPHESDGAGREDGSERQSVASSNWMIAASMAGEMGSTSSDDCDLSKRSSVVQTWADLLKHTKSVNDVFKPGNYGPNDKNHEDTAGSRQKFSAGILDRLRGSSGSLNSKYHYRYSPLETESQSTWASSTLRRSCSEERIAPVDSIAAAVLRSSTTSPAECDNSHSASRDGDRESIDDPAPSQHWRAGKNTK